MSLKFSANCLMNFEPISIGYRIFEITTLTFAIVPTAYNSSMKDDLVVGNGVYLIPFILCGQAIIIIWVHFDAAKSGNMDVTISHF